MAKPPSPQSRPAAAQIVQQALGLHRQGRLNEAAALYESVLARHAAHFEAAYLLGMLKMQRGQPAQALPLLEAAVKIKPHAPEALTILGAVLAALGRPAEALSVYERLIKVRPGDPDAFYNRGVVLTSLGRHADAVASYDRALAVRSDHVPSLFNKAKALVALEQFEPARAAYDALIAVVPNHVDALTDRGNVLARLGRRADALASFERALAANPGHVNALNNCGNLLKEEGRCEEALALLDRALAVDPRNPATLINRANVLIELERHAEAVETIDRALALAPADPEILFNRACALERLHRFEEALADLDRSLAAKPDSVKALNNRGNMLAALKRPEEAIASYDRALALEPARADALHNRGNVLTTLGRHAQAIADYQRAFALDPDHPHAFDSLGFAQLSVCNWDEVARLAKHAERVLGEGGPSVGTTFPLYYFGNPAYQLSAARAYLKANYPPVRAPLPPRTAGDPGKLRIAYLSSDFRFHPVATAIVEMLERHDRSRFEIDGISFGRDDASEIRSRLVRAFDRFHDVADETDHGVAELLRRLDVHIAVDLNGMTRGSRPRVLARRPAPVQVAYLGYPGTTGADFFDYILADATVLPLDQQPFFTETIVHLPDCYHPNDTTRSFSAAPDRTHFGLPEAGFVFCCSNQSHKISAASFDVWMRLLSRVDGSVLWLSHMNDAATDNLRRAVATRGIDPARVIFAPRLDRTEDYLARHRRADLFLDTLPYNAHSTAIDALWAGLPIVTCTGPAFSGRVAASLLKSIGLPELVTDSLEDYETLAAKLANDAALLHALRDRLDKNRATRPLFDMNRLCRHIETAYRTMWDIHARGERPRHFTVEALQQI
jgi:predicted O-linked N-acetylglucosamine transferase (SPINDLY family)